MENKVGDIVKHSTDFLNEFNRKADQCKDTVEYCALVASLFVFEELVLSDLSIRFLQDGTPGELDIFTNALKKQAKPIADPVIRDWNNKNLH